MRALPLLFLIAGCAPPPGITLDPDALPEAAPRAALATGASVEGRLTQEGPRSLRLGVPLAAYALQGATGSAVRIEARSSNLDTFLTVFTPEGRLLALNDDTRSSTDARLDLRLDQEGAYLVVVSGQRPTDVGTFRLEVRALDVDQGGPLALPGAARGILQEGSDVMVGRDTYFDGYTLTVDAPTHVVLEMVSETFDAYLFLADESGRTLAEDDDSGTGLDARLDVALDPGTYQVLATSAGAGQAGGYTLLAEVVEITEPGPLVLGEGVQGRLTSADPRLDEGRVHQTWTLVVEESGPVLLELGSAAFDTWLQLLDAEGALVAENDDVTFGVTDSELLLDLEPGRYGVVATHHPASSGGLYELRASPVGSGGGALTPPERVVGQLTTDHWVDPRRGTFRELYTLRLEGAATVDIGLASRSFDAYLVLLDESGAEVLIENDDAPGEGTNARIRAQLDRGTYQVMATTYGVGGVGAYELSVDIE